MELQPRRFFLFSNESRISCSQDEADEQPLQCATSQNRGEQRALSRDLRGSLALS